MRIMDKIKQFEDGSETIESFNEIFSTCPLSGFNTNNIVTIAEIAGPDTVRYVIIGEERFRHNFRPFESDNVVEVVDERIRD